MKIAENFKFIASSTFKKHTLLKFRDLPTYLMKFLINIIIINLKQKAIFT